MQRICGFDVQLPNSDWLGAVCFTLQIPIPSGSARGIGSVIAEAAAEFCSGIALLDLFEQPVEDMNSLKENIGVT
jgi:hypothetical protein